VIVGLTFSLYSLPIVLFSGAAGHLSDRFGTRSMVALSVGGLGAFALAYTITRSIPLVLIIGIIEGTATLAGFPAVMAYVSRHVGSEQQGRAQGLFSMFTAGGQALGALVGAYLFGVGIAWPFISVATVCFISLLAVPLFRTGGSQLFPPLSEAKPLVEV
jgi:DHA1 family multidrug resistance protein-like MFS transporter